ncbi:hypothetical protein SASPL_156518 [Salvia splendens]|uniref:Uncharacterized protein n=1 Tax=Salvia splendens TaxID=180675 RepID=A0A8X8YXT4_SALSN|nr:hypothetical protein SASPL_156518 [Salvia splendens]
MEYVEAGQFDLELVEVEYVPEKAELDGVDDEFRKIFQKFNFLDNAIAGENDKIDETAPDTALKKKADSDSEDEEQDTQQKEKGISNKKKKVLLQETWFWRLILSITATL